MNSEAIPFLVGGIIGLLAGARVTFSAAAAEQYARTSEKARLWSKLIGPERMPAAVHRFFGPVALLLGAVFLVLGFMRW